ncbi:MAG: hypothetical protein DWH86_03085 [Planctomycetota bacterium]|nr:MAG: hypothetical protein DWH86_03085 [Planctomycetota bacterium]
MADPAHNTPDRPRLEPMALAAFLVALVLGWCPFTALAAIVLAAIALRRIRRPGVVRTGNGLAIAAMVIATGILVTEGWLLGELQTEVQESMEAQAVVSIEGSMTVLPAVAPEWDDRGTPPSESERAEFARGIAAQAGAVRQVTVTRRSVEGLTDPTVSTAFNASCEHGTVFGNATFATLPATLPPKLVLRSIEVEFAGARVRLPALSAASPATPAPLDSTAPPTAPSLPPTPPLQAPSTP